MRKELWDLCAQLFARELSPDELGEIARAVLQEGHARAAHFGRVRAGLRGPLLTEDRILADVVMQRESQFLERFIRDLKSDRYIGADGEYIRAPINLRAQLYAAKLRGTANDTFVNASDGGARFEWILIAEDHCDDCPRIAAGGPYTVLTMPSRPGDGATQCITNCKCILLRDDGVLGPIYPYSEPGDEPL